MKTFLNVLYRRILYKIPLKFLLVLLAITAVFIACFSSADFVITPRADLTFRYIQSTSTATYTNDNGIFCLYVDNSCRGNNCGTMKVDGVVYHVEGAWANNGVLGNEYCTDGTNIEISGLSAYYYYFLIGNGFLNTWKPDFTSLQCQTEYNLIPIESVDQNYCESNNLCPSQECPVCPVGTGGYSQLYINNILHLGAPNIIMNIPDEIDWDYAYTAGGQNMNIDVVGYNVDYEKIDSIVAFQNYKPSSEDFQKIIGLLAPYTKIIVFFVFLFIIWAWIKKPFKSKKL